MFELHRELTLEKQAPSWKDASNGKARKPAPVRLPLFLRLLAFFGV